MGKQLALKHVLKNFLDHFSTLESRRKLNNEDDLYHKEFQSLKELTETLKKDPEYRCSKGLEEVNIRKNRYKDILPYDYSRVILSDYPGTPGSDHTYINANYVKGSTGSNCYIAAQGPLPSTVTDFWRMIFENEITVIVMACNETESGRFKCECYWPPTTDQDQQYGNITVSLVKWKQVCPDFLVRTLKIKSNNEERVVCQFHYLSWPDHSIPPSVSPILELVRLIRDVQASEARPILVHCSAGCGRTGTICSIDYVWALLRTGKLKEDFSLYSIISDMRRQRIAMVQTKEQYILCYRAVATLFEQQLKMIDAHTYENLNEDGEPLINSETDENQEEEDNDAVDNKTSSLSEKEPSTESPVNSEEDESYIPVQPDLIITKRPKNYFASLKQSRLHKSTPDFDCFQTTTTEVSEPNNPKHEKLVGKATVIRRSSRPSIAHLKAMFENMNLPNEDGFVHTYNRNKKPSLLKRSMSTREKVGSSSFNTWSTTNNLFSTHGSFENLNFFNSKDDNWKDKDYCKVSDDSNESEEELKTEDIQNYGEFNRKEQQFNYDHNLSNNENHDRQFNCTDNQFNNHQFNDNHHFNDNDQIFEPIYGFKKTVDEIDKEYIIENVDLPPPKPPRTYQLNENLKNLQEDQFKNSDTITNHSLNNHQMIDYNLPSHLSNKLSLSKNHYNTIGPIKHHRQDARPAMMYCFNETNYLKTYNQNKSKSIYNITSLNSKENQLVDVFEVPMMSRSVSINEMLNNNNNNFIYEAPRFGVLNNYNKNPSMLSHHQAGPLPNHLIKTNINNHTGNMGNNINNINNMTNVNNMNNINNVQINNYQEPQDFYGYIGTNNLNNINNLNNVSNNMSNNMSKPINRSYQLPTLPKPINHGFSSGTLPASYTTQISLNSQQQSQIKQPTFIQQPVQKVQPPMSYVKPMRNTSSSIISVQKSTNNFRAKPQLSVPAINMTNNSMNKQISNGNLHNLQNGMHMNGNLNGVNLGNINGTISNNIPNNNSNNLLPNSTSTISLGKLAKNYYHQPPTNLVHMNQRISSNLHSNSQSNSHNVHSKDKAIKNKTITVNSKDDHSLATNTYQNGLSKLDQTKSDQKSTKQNQQTESTSVVKTKNKKSAFNALSSIFGLKRKKDSKKANGSTTNLNVISVNNNVPNNGTNLIRPPHSHLFSSPMWSQV